MADIQQFIDGESLSSVRTKLNLAITEANKVDDKQDKPAEGAFVDGDKTKLDGIEGLAEVNEIENDPATNNTIGLVWSGTQAEYDALGSYDNATFYFTE